MTVGELKKFLQDVDDNLLVAVLSPEPYERIAMQWVEADAESVDMKMTALNNNLPLGTKTALAFR